MAWVKLVDGDPWLEVSKTGIITWDCDMHRMLRCPDWVEVMYDATAPARLGLRRSDYIIGVCIRVRENAEEETWSANAHDILDENSLLPDKTYETVPHEPAPPSSQSDYGDAGIVWWYIP